MIGTEVKRRINENNLVIAEVVINRFKGDELIEKNEFTIMQIKARRWKIYKDKKFFCYCKANSFENLINILERFEFVE